MKLQAKMQTIMGVDASPGMFRLGEFVYATDGRICGRCTGIEADEHSDFKGLKRERLESVFGGSENADWQPFEFEPVDCSKCNATYWTEEECDCCVRGEHECICGHSHTCGYCNGKGKIEDRCMHVREVCGVRVDDMYLSRMAAVGVTSVAKANDTMLWFRFSDGDGALMCTRHREG